MIFSPFPATPAGRLYDAPMNFAEAARIVSALPRPHTFPKRGRLLYEHIRENKPENVLELGTARGGSAVFIAAALEANGSGRLTSVDSLRWTWEDPTPLEVLEKAGLSDLVTLDRRFSTYTWFLKTEIEKHLDDAGWVRPVYDLIFLDGSKSWSTDGLAVVLAEKLLRPGGWLLLDDLGWTYEDFERKRNRQLHYDTDIPKLSAEERVQPHLRAIFDLLMRTNPVFDQFVVQDDWWGWAHKSTDKLRLRSGGVLSSWATGPGAPQSRLQRLRGGVSRHLPPTARKRLRQLERTLAR
jgi:predicted O-methyltransferase YrrM